ncbi:MAG: Flp pilus assembly protein CpaB [Selenomonadaceae bacterium]|nr:Flp pilus assembly protein CpaB [Selenomonadaceae bacterium]MBQ3726180.1 Flp pilus assembly protein CpaB [Selenomonadaceae bacterium]MBQ9497536.1 Flp pilus assembly protein CpaB [Selenomonadaceae bacterium]
MFTKVIRVLNSLVERFTPRQLLAGAAAIGLLVVLMVYGTLTHIESNMKVAQPKPVKLTKVVVAKTDIPRGAIIQKDMLKVKEFVEDSLPKGTAKDVAEFINLPTKMEIFAGDIVTTEKVYTDLRQAGFIGMIPEDCRAVTIPINNVTGIAGLLKAGDRVDIILLLNSDGGTKSTVLMQNVLLLSVNRDAEQNLAGGKETTAPKENSEDTDLESAGTEKPEEEESMAESVVRNVTGARRAPTGSGVGTATLALHPDEITRVIAASTIGRLYLALRPLKPRGDSMFIRETDYYTATGSSSPPAPKTPPPPPVPVIPNAPPQGSQLPPPNLPVIPGGKNPAPKNDAFEIIQWGN